MSDQTSPPPIVIGVDGSPAGLEALALGTTLAVLTGSPLVLAAVYGYEVDTDGPLWPSHAAAVQWLDEAELRLGDAIPWRMVTAPATTASRGLIAIAEAEDAAVVVLGSSRHGLAGHVLAGSTARQVVHGAPCAVAVVPHGWRLRPDSAPVTIGAAVTDAPESREALAVAARLAASAHARLRAMHVVHLLSPPHPFFAATGTRYAEWVESERRFGAEIARDAVQTLAPATEVEIKVLAGDPVETLAEVSAELDFLVLGSRRYGPLRSVVLGGVSGPLIERARCVVLIVPRGVHSTFAAAEPERASTRA